MAWEDDGFRDDITGKLYANDLEPIILDKHFDFLMDQESELDFLEGTVRSSKTAMGLVKFGIKVSESPIHQWILAGKDKATVERNIIDNDFGLLRLFPNEMKYYPKGIGGAHILYITPYGYKKIYIVGYDDESRWRKILGGTFGGGFIDEINTASMKFIKMYFTRYATIDKPYTCCTANPDDPNLEIYKTLNKCRPLKEYAHRIPDATWAQLKTQKPTDNWRYWHFDFNDNPMMDERKVNRLKATFDENDPFYKSHILGLRTRAEGLIYRAYNYDLHVYNIGKKTYQNLEIGIDYGQTKSAMSYNLVGINGPKVDILPEYYHKNAGSTEKKDDLDYAKDFIIWIKMNAKKHPELTNGGTDIKVRFDSASPAFARLLNRFCKREGWHHFRFIGSVKIPIVDRIVIMVTLLNEYNIKIDVGAPMFQQAISSAVYDEKTGVRRDDPDKDTIDPLDSVEYVLEIYAYQLLDAEVMDLLEHTPKDRRE